MKLLERERYIDGKFSILYGLNWETNEAIYRQYEDGEVVYIKVKFDL